MIACRDVSFSYPASGPVDGECLTEGALKHITCTIEDGSFVLLCGASGCGKTTLTRLLNGLIPHYHEGTFTGSVYLGGKDTRDLSLFEISQMVGSVFQNPRSQFFNVDTTSELAFGPENHGLPEKAVRERVRLVAEQLKEIIATFSIEAKIVVRKKYYVVYIKEGSQIVDILNVMEAHLSLMELENIRILKEMRGSVNRQVNCETANINKTVSAAVKQMEDIIYIRDTAGLNSLPETLREIAELRLARPEATLKELGEALDPPVGKSGVNHRLRKLGNMAEVLRQERPE